MEMGERGRRVCVQGEQRRGMEREEEEEERREEGGGADNTTFFQEFSAVLISPDYNR